MVLVICLDYNGEESEGEKMLKTFQEKRNYIQQSRLRNYRASLALEGITTVDASGCLDMSKAQLKEKYQKLSAESGR